MCEADEKHGHGLSVKTDLSSREDIEDKAQDGETLTRIQETRSPT